MFENIGAEDLHLFELINISAYTDHYDKTVQQ